MHRSKPRGSSGAGVGAPWGSAFLVASPAAAPFASNRLSHIVHGWFYACVRLQGDNQLLGLFWILRYWYRRFTFHSTALVTAWWLQAERFFCTLFLSIVQQILFSYPNTISSMEKFEVKFIVLSVSLCAFINASAGHSQHWFRLLWVRFAMQRKKQRQNGRHQTGCLTFLNAINLYFTLSRRRNWGHSSARSARQRKTKCGSCGFCSILT